MLLSNDINMNLESNGTAQFHKNCAFKYQCMKAYQATDVDTKHGHSELLQIGPHSCSQQVAVLFYFIFFIISMDSD